MTSPQRILAITGMHRSGTSLVASWLERCGLDLGDEYFEATYGNPRGHFEDLIFVGFHKEVLSRQGVSFVISPERTLHVSAQETREAYALLRERGARPQWGWKDPRTCLFLDFWRARLLQLRVLGLYRHFDSVVYSLMRRDLRQPAGPLKKMLLPVWHHPANLLLANRYVGTWIRYNRALLLHAEQFPDEVMLVASQALQSSAPYLFAQLTENWGFHLSPEPMEAVLVPEEFHKEVPKIKYARKLREEAESVWEELQSRRLAISGPIGNKEQSLKAASPFDLTGIKPGSTGT